ncbi:MAG: hypothetical protein AAGK21_00965 [Bacteroidota bacterium]
MLGSIARFIWDHPPIFLAIVLAGMYWLGGLTMTSLQLRGWISGAEPVERIVTDRSVVEATSSSPASFWIAWEDQSASVAGPNRAQLPGDEWYLTEVGQPVQLLMANGKLHWPGSGQGATSQALLYLALMVGLVGLAGVAVVRTMRDWAKRTAPQ